MRRPRLHAHLVFEGYLGIYRGIQEHVDYMCRYIYICTYGDLCPGYIGAIMENHVDDEAKTAGVLGHCA